MSFGSTSITVTINGTAKTLLRIGTVPGSEFSSRYYLREASREFTLNVRHSKEKPSKDLRQFDHHNVELIETVFATDVAPAQDRVAYVVFRNRRDDDYQKAAYIDEALLDLVADTGNIDSLLGWVS